MSVLEELGIEGSESGDGWLICLCPFHIERHPSFSVNVETGGWICFSKCGQGNIIQLISRAKGIRISEASEFLERRRISKKVSYETLLQALTKDKTEEESTEEPKKEFYDRTKFPSLLRRRGFDPQVLKKWGVGYSHTRNAAVIPVGDLGYMYRNIDTEFRPKYEYPSWLKKSHILFGLEHWEGPDMIVVEGPLDCIWMHQMGFTNTVAILGARVSKVQSASFFKTADVVCLLLDNDEAGLIGTEAAIQIVKNPVKVITLPERRKDPQECTQEELNEAVSKPISTLEWTLLNQHKLTEIKKRKKESNNAR